jgi:predicted amidophosphoribosyltransferase
VRCVFRSDSVSLTLDVPLSPISRWRAVARVLRSPMDALSYAIIPASCTFCGSPLPQPSPVPMSAVCWTEFARSPANARLHSGDSLRWRAQFRRPASLYRAAIPSTSRPCVLATAFVRAVAFGQDRGRRKDAIHACKYGHLYPRPGRLGRMPARAMAQRADQAPAEVPVVPVLLHQQKHEPPGFNRARTLAKNALSILKKSHPQWELAQAASTLLWQRWTGSKAGLTGRQLRLNMRGAFAVSDAPAVRSKHIPLLDDIPTAGPRRVRHYALCCSQEQPRQGWLRGRSASMSAGTKSAGTRPICKIEGDLRAGDTVATGRTRTDLSQGSSQGLNHRIVHRNTNHLFDEGIKDVAGKSYDSRP